MTEQRPSGYRGALPTRNDTIARPWVLAVVAIFVLMFVLAFLGFPSSLFPEPSGSPNPSFSLSPSIVGGGVRLGIGFGGSFGFGGGNDLGRGIDLGRRFGLRGGIGFAD